MFLQTIFTSLLYNRSWMENKIAERWRPAREGRGGGLRRDFPRSRQSQHVESPRPPLSIYIDDLTVRGNVPTAAVSVLFSNMGRLSA